MEDLEIWRGKPCAHCRRDRSHHARVGRGPLWAGVIDDRHVFKPARDCWAGNPAARPTFFQPLPRAAGRATPPRTAAGAKLSTLARIAAALGLLPRGGDR